VQCDAEQFCRSLSTYGRKLLPPSSGSKSKASEQHSAGGSTFLSNLVIFNPAYTASHPVAGTLESITASFHISLNSLFKPTSWFS
jgi:hypothetical protein